MCVGRFVCVLEKKQWGIQRAWRASWLSSGPELHRFACHCLTQLSWRRGSPSPWLVHTHRHTHTRTLSSVVFLVHCHTLRVCVYSHHTHTEILTHTRILMTQMLFLVDCSNCECVCAVFVCVSVWMSTYTPTFPSMLDRRKQGVNMLA